MLKKTFNILLKDPVVYFVSLKFLAWFLLLRFLDLTLTTGYHSFHRYNWHNKTSEQLVKSSVMGQGVYIMLVNCTAASIFFKSNPWLRTHIVKFPSQSLNSRYYQVLEELYTNIL